ncbi:MAG: SEL1-like repeat protein [Synergistaceae bacterium]|nr:SEL1-like repeat protein [Synergistaceae bacterium]
MLKHYKRAILLLVILVITFSAGTVFAAHRRVPVRPRPKLSPKIEQLRREADKGHVGSQFELGRIYYNGEGVKRDYKQAYYWYEKAANKGDANAQYRLAELFYSGHGTNQNYYNAAFWFRRACISNKRNDAEKDSAFQRGMAAFRAKDYKKAANLFKAAWSRPAAKIEPVKPRPVPKPAPAPVHHVPAPKPAPTPAPVARPEPPKPAPTPEHHRPEPPRPEAAKPAPTPTHDNNVTRPEPPKPVAKPDAPKPAPTPTPAPNVTRPEPPKPEHHRPAQDSNKVEHERPERPEKPRIPDEPKHEHENRRPE